MKLKEKMKNNKHKKFDKKKLIGTISKKHIKNGSYTMVMSVVFIAVVVVLNMIVNAIPSKYSEIDISSQKLYSIGDDTKAMLKDLDKDVTIYQIAQSAGGSFDRLHLFRKRIAQCISTKGDNDSFSFIHCKNPYSERLFENSRCSFYFQFLQDILWIFKFGKHDHSSDDVWFEACFFV